MDCYSHKNIDGNYSFFKLRQDPKYGNKKITWPSGSADMNIEAQIYDWESLLMASGRVLIAEGEMDAMLMKSKEYRVLLVLMGLVQLKIYGWNISSRR